VSEATPSDAHVGDVCPQPQPQLQPQPLPPECQQILDRDWSAHAPLPASSQTPTATRRILETLRLLHTADGLPWPEVARIVEYAATDWQPKGWIGSPAALRGPTKKGDRKTWEAIQAQMATPGRNGQPEYVPDFAWKDGLRPPSLAEAIRAKSEGET